jgi:hypothetical protein
MSYEHFAKTRDTRGNPAEHLVVELFRLNHIPAFLNPAPESDYDSRAAYDVALGTPEQPWELLDVKADWMSWSTHNLCVEANSLRHTKATKFIYLLPRPSSLYLHVFPVSDLIALYNAQVAERTPAGERTRYFYEHKNVGDQLDNDAVLVPMDSATTLGCSFWEMVKAIKQEMRQAA